VLGVGHPARKLHKRLFLLFSLKAT